MSVASGNLNFMNFNSDLNRINLKNSFLFWKLKLCIEKLNFENKNKNFEYKNLKKKCNKKPNWNNQKFKKFKLRY